MRPADAVGAVRLAVDGRIATFGEGLAAESRDRARARDFWSEMDPPPGLAADGLELDPVHAVNNGRPCPTGASRHLPINGRSFCSCHSFSRHRQTLCQRRVEVPAWALI